MLAGEQKPKPEDAVSAREEVRDPYLLEFLNLKDEYSETELEDAIIEHLQAFLLEMGDAFTFVTRQRRIRIGRIRRVRGRGRQRPAGLARARPNRR